MSDKYTIGNASRLNELSDRLGCLFKRKADAMHQASRWVRTLLILSGAALAGASQFIPPPPADIGGVPWNLVLGLIGTCLAFAGGFWSIFVDQTAPEALDEARKAVEISKELRAEAEAAIRKAELETLAGREQLQDWIEHSQWLGALNATTMTLMEAVENILASGKPPTGDDFQTLLEDEAPNILKLLEFEVDEYWTLAIYQYVAQGEGGQLVCTAHMRSQRTDEKKEHRSWGVGEGIAGQAYAIKEELIVADLTEKSQAMWLNVPRESRRDGDESRYRSFAAVPIRSGNSPLIWGVAVASSDRPSRFAPEEVETLARNVQPLRIIANCVALAAAPHSNHLSNVIDISSGKPEV